jgi:acyl-CoA synthetase (AMP-forming)/AMP-acid ligase II
MPVAAQLQSCFETMPSVRYCIAIGEPVPAGWWRLEQLVENQNPDRARALAERAQTLGEADGALMVFTGGVTGMPKGAVLSHKNIIANIAAQNRNLGWRADDRTILHLPMNHVSGATLLTIGALMSGATLVMLERFHPERTLAAVQREQVTILGQVPSMWIMEFSLPNFAEYDLSSVRMTIVSGAPTPGGAMLRMAAIAPVAHHVYGLTEAAGMVTYNLPGDGIDTLLRFAGRTTPEFELRIVAGDRKPVGPGQEGEIAVRGDCVMTGYFEEPEETAHVIDEEGWLYTGDLGRLDENGYLAVTGLIKRMYFSGGYNVYPAEVEAYLDQHPDIDHCACSSVPHPIMGETGEIWVAPRDGVALSRHEIRAYCKAGLARYKRPTHIHIVDALP